MLIIQWQSRSHLDKGSILISIFIYRPLLFRILEEGQRIVELQYLPWSGILGIRHSISQRTEASGLFFRSQLLIFTGRFGLDFFSEAIGFIWNTIQSFVVVSFQLFYFIKPSESVQSYAGDFLTWQFYISDQLGFFFRSSLFQF